jgi:hypothetical protein
MTSYVTTLNTDKADLKRNKTIEILFDINLRLNMKLCGSFVSAQSFNKALYSASKPLLDD